MIIRESSSFNLPERRSREVGNKPHIKRQQMGLYEAGIPRQASLRSSLNQKVKKKSQKTFLPQICMIDINQIRKLFRARQFSIGQWR